MAYNSGDWGGVMMSTDKGATWAMTSFPPNYYVTAIAIRSPSRFVVSARAEFHDRDDGGVWATDDGGKSFTRTLDVPVYDLLLEPTSGALLARRREGATAVHRLAVSKGRLFGPFPPAGAGERSQSGVALDGSANA